MAMTLDGKLVVAMQRAWLGETMPRIAVYDLTAKTWQFHFYPLDPATSPNGGWVGLSEITALGNNRFLVVEREGKVAGYAYCLPWKDRPAYQGTVEDSIYLAPWATGQGAGSELLGALLEASRAADVREVIAVIADSGDPSSIALHQKLGFEDAGRLRQVGHKHGRDIDTVLLQCSLR